MSSSTAAASGAGAAASASNDIFGYIEALPPPAIVKLYEDPQRGMYACRAVLQHLPELARQYVLRLVVCGGVFATCDLELWCKNRSGGRRGSGGRGGVSQQHRLALERMRAMQVIVSAGKGSAGARGGGGEDIRLRTEFYNGIRKSMTSLQSSPWAEAPHTPSSMPAPSKSSKSSSKHHSHRDPSPPPSIEELELYTQRRWDSVLHFLVGSEDMEEYPPAAVVHFLERTGLMQEDPDWKPKSYHGRESAPLVITSKGYEFMLRDVRVQVWQFILQYFDSLSMHSKCDEIRHEALLFLLCLSYCRVGAAYAASSLSKDTRILMKDFAQFGLVYVRKVAAPQSSTTSSSSSSVTTFYPTRVAVNLVAGSAAVGGPSSSGGSNAGDAASSSAATRALEMALAAPNPGRAHIAIIVQTNFQLCAYTTSELHVSMLGLFCEVFSFRRLPNVCFFRISRDSIKSAFRLGIEAAQIILFLRMHAHPKLRTGDQPLIPKNVEDQILLWERERKRVVMEEVWMYQCGPNQDEFEAVKQYAVDLNACAWASEAKSKIYVRYAFAERVKAFVMRWRARSAQRAAM